MQQKTAKAGEKQLILNFKFGLEMEIRVAADTCIGRSELSDIIDTSVIDFNEENDFEEDSTSCSSKENRLPNTPQPKKVK